ncbi:unnamed protein product [Gongylonema pulchrum]|uniref:Class II glutamine amidotransferase n=1 Tax=Gongylonema pulchrum TaxID=637853 RepID=A0A183CYF4_9BILA|nr:unnamed protein product [Gongylonema pulchrum]
MCEILGFVAGMEPAMGVACYTPSGPIHPPVLPYF